MAMSLSETQAITPEGLTGGRNPEPGGIPRAPPPDPRPWAPGSHSVYVTYHGVHGPGSTQCARVTSSQVKGSNQGTDNLVTRIYTVRG